MADFWQAPDALCEAAERNQLIFFVGSGVSTEAGLPSWARLLQLLAQSAAISSEVLGIIRSHITSGHLIEVATYLRDVMSNEELHNGLSKFLGNNKPSHLHHTILSAAVRGVVTTNYDSLLETADVDRHLGVPFTWRHSALATRLNAPFLFKAHGSLDDPESIILASQDYEKLYTKKDTSSDQYLSFLRALFSPAFRILFIGFGFRDPDLNLLIRQVKVAWKDWNRPFALLPVVDPSRPDPVVDQSFKLGLGVQPIYIPMESGRGPALDTWLTAFMGGRGVESGPNRSVDALLQEGLAKVLSEHVGDRVIRSILQEFGIEIGEFRGDSLRSSEAANAILVKDRSVVIELVRALLRSRPESAMLKNLVTLLPVMGQSAEFDDRRGPLCRDKSCVPRRDRDGTLLRQPLH